MGASFGVSGLREVEDAISSRTVIPSSDADPRKTHGELAIVVLRIMFPSEP